MLLFGGKKDVSYLGVDLGSSGIKLVELGKRNGALTLLTYGYSQLSPADRYDFLDKPKKAAEVLRSICAQAGCTSKTVMVALPTQEVFSAIVTTPAKQDAKQRQVLINAQAQKLAPLPLSEMITYTTIIDDTRVLVSGAPKALIQKFIDVFAFSGLELKAIDTESFALIRSLLGKDMRSVMILDMGEQRTSLHIVEKGIPFLKRSVEIGGTVVTKAIMEQMGVAFNEAEQIKIDLSGTDNAGEMPAVIKPLFQTLLNEVHYALELYRNQEESFHSTVEKILLTGGSSHLPFFRGYLAKELNINVYRGDPFARVQTPKGLQPLLDDIAPKLAVATGLAMREIDT